MNDYQLGDLPPQWHDLNHAAADQSADQSSTKPLVRTVDHLKSTTTNMRGFADSVDHLLNALEEFYPFIDKIISGTEQLRNTMRKTPQPMYRRRRRYR